MMEQSIRISRLERNGILIFSAITLLAAFIYIRQQRKLKHQQDKLNVLVTKDYELKALQSQIR
jgi:preprotein translocase subunit YajC